MDTLAVIKRIEMRLSEIGMSKAEFYKNSGVSSATFSQWRSGMYTPSEKKLSNAAKTIGVSLSYLLNGTLDKQTHIGGVHIYSHARDSIEEILEDFDEGEFRIVQKLPGFLVIVENDSKATDKDIKELIALHNGLDTEKAPDELKLTEGEELLIRLFRQIPEERQKVLLEMVRVFAESLKSD